MEQEPTTEFFLRVRRRGAITAASSTLLRVELDAALAAASAFADVDLQQPDTSDDDHHHHDNNHNNYCKDTKFDMQQKSIRRMSSTALFRRVESSHDPLTSSHRYHHHLSNNKNSNNNNAPRSPLKRRLVLDAVLLDETVPTSRSDDHHHGEESKGGQHKFDKRRRLTLQLLEPAVVVPPLLQQQQQQSSRNMAHHHRNSPPQLAYPILSPEQRAVDDSLQQVFDGTLRLAQHLQFLESAFRSPSTVCGARSIVKNDDHNLVSFWPWMWCHTDCGNLLHAAAIWNEALIAKEILDILQQRLSDPQQQYTFLTNMLQTLNRDRLNPIEVAQISGNREVLAVLETHVKNLPSQQEYGSTSMDDGLYDLYSLVPDCKAGDVHGEKGDGHLVIDCELLNGCTGFWDDKGELIMAPALPTNTTDTGGADDEVDSNDEDWNGNDYPDEEVELDDWSGSFQSSGSDVDNDFRRRPANIYDRNHYDEDDNSANYDPSYGGIYGQSDSAYSNHL
jgi:hypothetical protein